jgi:uncharacterized membrane protein
MTLLLVIQWLHILMGLIWFGGYVFMAFALWPALLRLPGPQAKAIYEAIERPAGTLMFWSGTLVFWLGLLRGIWLGPVQSLQFVFNTAYGLTFLTALIVAIVLTVYGGVSSRKLAQRVWDGDQFRPDAAQYLRSSYAFALICFAIILACMVLMRFGL